LPAAAIPIPSQENAACGDARLRGSLVFYFQDRRTERHEWAARHFAVDGALSFWEGYEQSLLCVRLSKTT